MPAPLSLPEKASFRRRQVPFEGLAERTLLDGPLVSIVLTYVGVSIGSSLSKTIEALFAIWAPVLSPALGETPNDTPPSPAGGFVFGGRNPSSGSVSSSPVAGSSP